MYSQFWATRTQSFCYSLFLSINCDNFLVSGSLEGVNAAKHWYLGLFLHRSVYCEIHKTDYFVGEYRDTPPLTLRLVRLVHHHYFRFHMTTKKYPSLLTCCLRDALAVLQTSSPRCVLYLIQFSRNLSVFRLHLYYTIYMLSTQYLFIKYCFFILADSLIKV